MIKTVKLALIALFLVMAGVLLTWFKLTQPRILVLHSYDTDYAWTRDIDAGIRRAFSSNLRYKIDWHYMDTKVHPDRDFKRKAGVLARRAIESINPDLIIAVDDDAQQYAVKEYANHPKIRIVFAGINGTVEAYGYRKAANVTGIYERKPIIDLSRALAEMRGRDGEKLGTRIAHIGDLSDSVVQDKKEIDAFNWAPFKLVSSTLVTDFDEWRRAVKEAGAKADIIVLSNYQAVFRAGKDQDLFPPAELMKWTEENSPVPVVGLGGFMVEEGGMFAVGASGFEQGDTVAHMAMTILDRGEIPRNIPEVMPRQFLVYMRESLLAKRGITLPPLYEAFSRASNNYHK